MFIHIDICLHIFFSYIYFLHIFFHSAPKEGLYCKPKYRTILFNIILSFIPFYFVLIISTVRISVQSIFCIIKFLLIQVYSRSGTLVGLLLWLYSF